MSHLPFLVLLWLITQSNENLKTTKTAIFGRQNSVFRRSVYNDGCNDGFSSRGKWG